MGTWLNSWRFRDWFQFNQNQDKEDICIRDACNYCLLRGRDYLEENVLRNFSPVTVNLHFQTDFFLWCSINVCLLGLKFRQLKRFIRMGSSPEHSNQLINSFIAPWKQDRQMSFQICCAYFIMNGFQCASLSLVFHFNLTQLFHWLIVRMCMEVSSPCDQV